MKTLAPSFLLSVVIISNLDNVVPVTVNMSILDGLHFSESIKVVVDLENFLKVKSK